MSRLASGEGEVGGNEEDIEPHPLVLVARLEMVGGGRSMADRVAAAEGLWWWMVDEGWPISCARVRQS